MKKAISFIVTVLSISYSLAQAPVIQWQQSYGGTSSDYANEMQPALDGGFIVAGSSTSNNGNVSGNNGNSDFWVVKLNAAGNMQWQKSLGGSGSDIARTIITTPDGGYVVAGETGSNNGDVTGNHGGLNDYWVVKLDATGTLEWQKTFGGSSNDVAESIQATSDGGYIIAGASNSNNGNVTGNHGDYDYWIVKIDATGNIQWQKSLGGTGNDEAKAMLKTSDGGYILTGLSSTANNGDVTGNHGGLDYWVVKLDAAGNVLWQKSYGGSSGDEATCIQTTSDGGYIVAGTSSSNNGNVTGNHGSYDYWVVKTDSDGNILWQVSLGGSSFDIPYAIQTTGDGGYVIAGESGSNNGNVTGNHGNYDSWVVKLDAIGTIQWQKSMGGSGSDKALAILITADSGYIVAGYNNSINGDVTGNQGNSDIWLVKLSPDVLANATFDKYVLTIYPNPVNEVLQFRTSGSEAITKVKIMDLSGKIVFEQSPNADTINIEKLAQGMYILEAYSGDEKYTNKFLKK